MLCLLTSTLFLNKNSSFITLTWYKTYRKDNNPALFSTTWIMRSYLPPLTLLLYGLHVHMYYVVHVEILPRALMCLAAAAALLCLTYMLGYGKLLWKSERVEYFHLLYTGLPVAFLRDCGWKWKLLKTKFFRPRFFSDVHTVSFIGVNPKSVFTQEFVWLVVQCCIKRDRIYQLLKICK